MLRLSPGLPTRLAQDRVIALVSATNGKSAITTMIGAALRAEGRTVASNIGGANMMPGLVTALAAAPDAQYGILETDEAVVPRALRELAPTVIVVGELSRDQLDRHHEVRKVAALWRSAFVGTSAQFVAPVNDPNVVWALEGQAVDWVELETSAKLDSVACPKCASVLRRTGEPSGWSCACGLESPRPHAVQRGDSLQVGDWRAAGPTVLPGRWQQSNRALAVVASTHLDVSLDRAFEAASTVARVGRRIDTMPITSGRAARLVLVKNPAGWAALIDDLGAGEATLVFVQNDESADGRDPSWLWDVPYERLARRPFVASGTRALDVAVRLRTAGLELVAVEPDPLRALAIAGARSGGDVVVAASYTAYHDIVRRIGRR